MKIKKIFRIYYNKLVESIAFYPAIIAVGFLLLSWVMISFDFSETGKEFKASLSWLSLKDASTARSIVSTVAGAIISLTVFSFSMVMIVLNQAASQMSNRVLNSMIENRFQQIILGFYIGTIVYALFLLSTIRDVESGILVPALSIYLLVLLTVIDIFLFIYFLDYVTQTVKYETVVDRVSKQTLKAMQSKYIALTEEPQPWEKGSFIEVRAKHSGYFQNFNHTDLVKLASKDNFHISFTNTLGTYLLKNSIVLKIYYKTALDQDLVEEISDAVDFYAGQPIDINPDYGFRQLSEIALKALSPGINDPGTAVISLNSLSDLFQYLLYHKMPSIVKDDDNESRIFLPTSTFTELFDDCIPPIWNYGKEGQYIQDGLLTVLKQLKIQDYRNLYSSHFDKWIAIVESKIAKTRF